MMSPSLLVLSLILLLYIDTGVQGTEDGCRVEVRVPRNSAMVAVEKTTLAVQCPFKHCGEEATITWCKVNNTTLCVHVRESDHLRIGLLEEEKDIYTNISVLTITNLTSEDAGLYRCEISSTGLNKISSVSHYINVSVTPPNGHQTTVSPKNSTRNETENKTTRAQLEPKKWLPFFFICLGIAVLVAIVVAISFFSMRQCEGSKGSGKNGQPNNQRTAPLASYQASPQPSLPSRPRSLRTNPVRTSDGPPGVYNHHFKDRRASRNKHKASGGALPTGSSASGQVAASMDQQGLHSKDADQESNVIVYAALNHNAIRDSSVASRTLPLEDQQSEYAAIRIN